MASRLSKLKDNQAEQQAPQPANGDLETDAPSVAPFEPHLIEEDDQYVVPQKKRMSPRVAELRKTLRSKLLASPDEFDWTAAETLRVRLPLLPSTSLKPTKTI